MDEPEDDLPDDMREDATAAAATYDDTAQPGGGGLMNGTDAQTVRLPGGTAPNAPIDTGVKGGSPADEAKARATEDDTG